MKRGLFRLPGSNRRGMILIVALLIMAVMSFIGAIAMTNSQTELKITQATRVSREAFYAADGSIEIAPKIVREVVDLAAIPTESIPNVKFPEDDADTKVLNEIMGFGYTGPDTADAVWPTAVDPDLEISIGDSSGTVDIDRIYTSVAEGSGAEFASGAEGLGVSTVTVFYTIETVATGPTSALSHLDVYYRNVLGVPGGK